MHTVQKQLYRLRNVRAGYVLYRALVYHWDALDDRITEVIICVNFGSYYTYI